MVQKYIPLQEEKVCNKPVLYKAVSACNAKVTLLQRPKPRRQYYGKINGFLIIFFR
jgi:hypothetical protein